MVGEGILPSVALQLRPDQGFLVQVLALLAVFIDPEVGEHLGDVVGHESAEDGVAGILCGCGQDAQVEVLLHREGVGNLVQEDAPLVVAEVVDDDEEDLLALVEQGEDGALEDVGTHHGPLLRLFHPSHVVLAYELGEPSIGLAPLHGEHLLHAALRLAQLQFPVGEFFIDLLPLLDAGGVVDEHPQTGELLLVARLRVFRHDFLLLDVLLERQQDLCGVDGLDEVVGNLGADGLFHDVLLLALRDHHDGCGGQQFLDAVQCLQSAQSGHVLVEQDEVERLLGAAVQGIVAVRHRFHLVAFLLEEEDVSLQQLNLVVNPKQFVCSHGGKLRISLQMYEYARKNPNFLAFFHDCHPFLSYTLFIYITSFGEEI